MNNQTIGIIGAMEEEIDLLRKEMEETRKTIYAGISFYEGIYHNRRIIVCKSGVGKVNAAVCSQLLIDRFQIESIFFTGVAGALDLDLEIGDIVISTECIQHDVDVTALGFERGVIPYQETSRFKADEHLQNLAFQCSQELFPDKVKKGRVLSGDQFIASRELVTLLREQLQGSCTEMEGAAVAQVCVMNEIPFVIIRSMSDKADGSAHVNFPEFVKQASEHSHRIIAEMLKRMPVH